MFAKLFGTDDDQILVTIDESDEGPEVRFSCEPKGLGVCSIASKYSDDEDGWDKAEKAFADVDEERAREAAKLIVRGAKPFVSPNA